MGDEDIELQPTPPPRKRGQHRKAVHYLIFVVNIIIAVACFAGAGILVIGQRVLTDTKKSAAMELTSKLLNDERDEDREGPGGFESKAERARLFAAEMALQSFALMAAAEGAITAYADLTGDEWKPYEAPLAPAASVSRKSAATEMAAFEMAAISSITCRPASLIAMRGGASSAWERACMPPSASVVLWVSLIVVPMILFSRPLLTAAQD